MMSQINIFCVEFRSNEKIIIGLAYQGKDIVFRFIIEYSSLRDFYTPLCNNNRSICI